MNTRPITGTTSLVGLMGWPVEHSLSPIMHNAAFAQVGCDFAYVPLPVRPQQVEPALKGLAALNFVGSNVTIPHKQAVMRYLDELSEAARLTGIRTRRALVHEALRALVEQRRRRPLTELRGKVTFAPGYDYKAARAGNR